MMYHTPYTQGSNPSLQPNEGSSLHLGGGEVTSCTLGFQTYARERSSSRLLMCHKSLQGFVWIWCVQQMIVNFSSSKVIQSVYPRLLHIISMQQGNGRSNYCGLQTWHPPSLRQPLPSWWDSVWAFTRLLPNEFPLKLRTELFKSTARFRMSQWKQNPASRQKLRLCV